MGNVSSEEEGVAGTPGLEVPSTPQPSSPLDVAYQEILTPDAGVLTADVGTMQPPNAAVGSDCAARVQTGVDVIIGVITYSTRINLIDLQ